MKIIQLVSNRVWGGGERYALDLTTRLLADGHEVFVVTRGVEVVDEQFAALGVPIFHAPFKGILDYTTPRIIRDIIRKHGAGEQVIIHSHDFKNALLAVRAKRNLPDGIAKIVVTRHLIKPAKNDYFNKKVYRNLDSLIFISNLVREVFLSTNPEIPETKLHTVHNSILNPPKPLLEAKKLDETEKTEQKLNFAKTDETGETEQKLNFPKTDETGKTEQKLNFSDPVVLSFIGRISPEKGVDMLLDALSFVTSQNWRLRIVGTGDTEYLNTLREKAEKLNLTDKIEWTGYVSDRWSEINKADIGLFPSVWREPFGLTILEFMSQGKPLVSTDTGAQKEIITDGIDSLLSSPNPEEFAINIDRLVSDTALRRQLGVKALETFSKFDYENFYKGILKAYASV